MNDALKWIYTSGLKWLDDAADGFYTSKIGMRDIYVGNAVTKGHGTVKYLPLSS